MRGYGIVAPQFWIDSRGASWPVLTIRGRIKFRYPAALALRVHVFTRDRFTCQVCGETAKLAGEYDGSEPPALPSGRHLVLDHVLSRRNGGSHHPGNLQALCDACNARKASLVDAKGGSA